MHPDYLLPKLTSRQFAEWVAYYSIHPFGDDIDHYQLAVVASELTNRWRGKGEERSEPEDFIPGYKKPPQTGDEMNAILNQAIQASNGRR